MNHTSDQHPWFVASRCVPRGAVSPTGTCGAIPSGWDDDGRPLPPNGWVSFFGGPGWEWEPAREQFYYHTFLVEQPELDWRAPGVEAAQFAMVQGWLDRGVDGFRLDVFNNFLKHPDLPSNPTRPGDSAWDRQVHIYDRDQPDFPDAHRPVPGDPRCRPGTDVGRRAVRWDRRHGGRAARPTSPRLRLGAGRRGRGPRRPSAAAIARREAAFGPDRWPTVVLSNHDQPRHASRFAASIGADDQDAIAKAAAVLSLTVRGTPFLYYGEELGLGDVDVPPDERIDLAATRTEPGTTWWERSPCRTPMPWTGEPGGGFTTGVPWLRLGEDTAHAQRRGRAGRPGLGAGLLSPPDRRPSGAPEPPGRRASTLLADDHPTVVAFRRGTGRGAVVVVDQYRGRAGRDRGRRSSRMARCEADRRDASRPAGGRRGRRRPRSFDRSRLRAGPRRGRLTRAPLLPWRPTRPTSWRLARAARIPEAQGECRRPGRDRRDPRGQADRLVPGDARGGRRPGVPAEAVLRRARAAKACG